MRTIDTTTFTLYMKQVKAAKHPRPRESPRVIYDKMSQIDKNKIKKRKKINKIPNN